jgi:hypothetical protein
MLRIIFRHHPGLKYTVHERSTQTSQQPPNEKNDDIVGDLCQAAHGVGAAEDEAGQAPPVLICQSAHEEGGDSCGKEPGCKQCSNDGFDKALLILVKSVDVGSLLELSGLSLQCV